MTLDLQNCRCRNTGKWNSTILLLWHEAPFTRCFFLCLMNTDFVAQQERAIAYEAIGWRFESFQNHKVFLERNWAYWGNGNFPDCLSGTTSSKCFAFTKSLGKITKWVISYKPQNGVFSLFGKISNCGFEEQGSIPENTQINSGKITVVVYSPWTREVASSNLASQTKCRNGGMVDASDLGSEFWRFEPFFLYKKEHCCMWCAVSSQMTRRYSFNSNLFHKFNRILI